MCDEFYSHRAHTLDSQEARAVERSIFERPASRKGRKSEFERKPVLAAPIDLSIIEGYFSEKQADQSGSNVAEQGACGDGESGPETSANQTRRSAGQAPDTFVAGHPTFGGKADSKERGE